MERALTLYGIKENGRRVTYDEWREAARSLSPEKFGYLDGAAGRSRTAAANEEAFARWRVVPRMLRAVAETDLSVTLFGHRYPFPVLLGPIGVQTECHPEAERATARAARRVGMPMVLSTVSSVPMEDVAGELGPTPRWFQLYPGRDPAVNRSFIERAEAAGYEVLVVTLDTTRVGFRPVDLAHAHLPFLSGEGIANYLTDAAFASGLGHAPEATDAATIQHFLRVYVNPTLSWQDIDAIIQMTKLPVVLKGVLHPEDAREALEHGVAGVIVSNHGGRQVDGAVASLDALPGVREAVGDRMAVLLDSGVRSAADVVKALSLGADAVLIARLYAYALAADGARGVEACLLNLIAELDTTMLLAGFPSVAGLGPDALTLCP